MTQHSQSTKDKMKALSELGLSSREIAKLVLGSETKKSSVNRVLASEGTTSKPKKDAEDNSRILFISDLHIPYHHPDSFDFLRYLKDKYKPTRVISLGDECFPPDVEVLTENGFIRFDQLQNEKIGQWEEDGKISYVTPERKVVKEFNGKLLEFKHKTMTVRCTPKHTLVKLHPATGKVHRREAWDYVGTESWSIPRTGVHDGVGVSLTDSEIKLLVAFQADGTFTKGAARFMFTKERKAQRLMYLLEDCNIPYNTHTLESGGYQFYIEKDNVPNYFTKVFSIPAKDFSVEQKKIFLNEIGHWDGTAKEGRVRYTSAVLSNVEYVQFMASTSGYYASKVKREGNCHRVDVVWEKEQSSFKSAKKTEIDYDGKVYCVTVDSGMIVVRVDGNILVTGNCDKHSLSFHDSDPDLYSAGDELRASQEYIHELEEIFPKMDILESNHGSLVWRKAKTNGIPKHYIKSYNDVLGVGKGWKWHFDLTLDLPDGTQCYVHHGKASDVLKLSQQMGMSAVQGHYHTDLGARFWANPNGLYFGMQCGCLIDRESYAFAYSNVNIKKQLIGTGLIIDSLPIIEPMILLPNGRWKGD
mgnify:CR=1 FL=1